MRDIRLENISEKEPLNKFICCGFLHYGLQPRKRSLSQYLLLVLFHKKKDHQSLLFGVPLQLLDLLWKPTTDKFVQRLFFEAAVHNVEKLIEKVKKPAALICATDRIAQGAYKVFYEKNIAIPEEVSVVGFGDYETGELMRPPLTTVKFDWKNWGESSAETMLQMIQEKPVSQIQVNPYEFIERESVR